MIGIKQKVLPQPVLSIVLLITWLLAHGSIDGGTLASGIVLAVLVPIFTASFWPEAPRIKRLRPLVQFFFIVSYDIVIANLTVARLILGSSKKLQPIFMEVPVSLENSFLITTFAATISLTPGTVSASLSGDRKTLLVHALDCTDEETTIKLMKARYEQPLLEAFEC